MTSPRNSATDASMRFLSKSSISLESHPDTYDEWDVVLSSRGRSFRTSPSRTKSSAYSDAESYHEYQSLKGKLLGGALFLSIMVCALLFVMGLYQPLVEVDVFPGGTMESKLVKSVMGIIEMPWQAGFYLPSLVMVFCIVGIPMLLLCGALVILWDGFISVGFKCPKIMPFHGHSLLVSVMYISTSYQAVLLFVVVLFMCFFTGGGSDVAFRHGFYYLSLYCLVSIGVLQAMEGLRVGYEDEEDEVLPSVTGLELRRHFSSFFPSLPGVKRTDSVDAFQVFFFDAFFLILLALGFDQPLLDIRVMLKGVALERMVLSLKDIIIAIANSAPLPVVAVFVALVVVLPIAYGLVLVLASAFSAFSRCCCSPLEHTAEWYLSLAHLLRPWALIDVFSIALSIVLYAGYQNEFVVATIPDGIVQLQRSQIPSVELGEDAWVQHGQGRVFWLQFFSGSYLIAGAGIATFFLRWFWSAASPTHAKHPDDDLEESISPCRLPHLGGRARSEDSLEQDELQHSSENCCTKYILGKSCRVLLLWTLLCFGLHSLPSPVPMDPLQHLNQVANTTLPTANQLIAKFMPASAGNCAYPATPGRVPQPCLDAGSDWIANSQQMMDNNRITLEWISGWNTMQLTNFHINRQDIVPDAAQGSGQLAQPLQRYELEVEGEMQNPGIFLRIEMCELNHTSLKPIIGKGRCKHFMDSGDACCEKNRRFKLKLASDCRIGDDTLSNFQVAELHIDNVTATPRKVMGHTTIEVADMDITTIAMDMIKENIKYYMLEEKLIRFAGRDLNVVEFLDRVLRFNAPHQQFHCR